MKVRDPSSSDETPWTQVIEPDMPESYKRSPLVNQERYMSTFRGCACPMPS